MTETNQYIKQFPELMNGKTILYVHGFGSSGQSGTVDRLRQVLPNARVVAPDLPIHPDEAMALLQDTCQQTHPHLIIATSMGGMFAEMLYGYDRILTNPAFHIADTMQSHGLTGKQQFFSPRADGIQEFYVDKPLVKEYRLMTERCFAHAQDEGEVKRVFGLFGDEDPLVDTYDTFLAHYPQAIRFHGEHRMNDRSFMHSVLPVIRWIDDRQQQRERPVIFIGTETLRDAYQKPTSSCQKAISILQERYALYFVAPATSLPSEYDRELTWLEQYVNVPAWGHTIFTNQRQLLLGDYLIECGETKGGMTTSVAFGSDTFKTWEDIIEYFSRLGGQ